MNSLIKLLIEKNMTIGSCESITGGLFASSLAEIPGASKVLKGGLITYQNVCKINLARVEQEIIEQYGSISQECAIAMAQNAKALLDVDICVSFSGNAGPHPIEGKPTGLIFCAIAYQSTCRAFQFTIRKKRNEIRREIVSIMSEKCLEVIQEINE